MAEIDGSYQPKVGFEQGAKKIYVKQNGYMKFYDQDVSGEDCRVAVYDNNKVKVIAASDGALSVINFDQGVIFISASVGGSNMSAWLTSCIKGQRLRVDLQRLLGTVESVLSVFISLSGVSLIGFADGDLSSISLHNSEASGGFIEFIALSDNEWAILNATDGKYVEHVST